MLKILHISDIHLDAKFLWLGKKAPDHRKKIQETFSKSIDFAIKEKLNLIIISGDIFDSPYPDQIDIDKFTRILNPAVELGIEIIILPGNHDHINENSVWTKEFPKLKVFSDPTSRKIELKSLNLILYGEPQTEKKTIVSPLKHVLEDLEENKEHDKDKYKIVIAHGGVLSGIKSNTDSSNSITIEEINQLKKYDINYLALGDWHGQKKIEAALIPAYYPGSIELLDLKQANSGYGIMIQIENPNQESNIKPIRFSDLKLHREELNINQNSQDTILQFLQKNQDPTKLLRIKIIGTQSLKDNLDAKNINVINLLDEYSDKYYFLKITDESDIQVTQSDLNEFPKESVPYNFIKLMESETKKGGIPEDLQDEILSLGLHIIVGNNND
jgi:DNA repair exonuclease SbcCD nuclease subunit